VRSSGPRRVVIAGGGAAGFFAAIACAEADPSAIVTLYEATAHPLVKVRVSGGGRCNVTHARFEPAELVRGYPRGARELLGPLHRFGPRETVAWFSARGVELKTEGDGRMFPTTDDSATVVDCLWSRAQSAGVRLMLKCGIRSIACRTGLSTGSERSAQPEFTVDLTSGDQVKADRILLATGGTKGSAGLGLAAVLGHAVVPPVPSLFTFHVDDARLRGLEGLSVPWVTAAVTGTTLKEAGPILVTHWGLSGPAILKLSSWGARKLHETDYHFSILVNWAGGRSSGDVENALRAERSSHPRRKVATSNPFGVPARLWTRLIMAAGVEAEAIWTSVSNDALRALAAQTAAGEFAVAGKSMNKEEFVTCGGVSLREVDFATMESRLHAGLHFAGEILDIDGITGGFNFQAAWTTGWHAGRAMAGMPV